MFFSLNTHPPECISFHESPLPIEISHNILGVGMNIFWNQTIVEDVSLHCWRMLEKYPTDVCGRKLDSNPTQFYLSFSMDYIISGDRLGNNMQKQDPTMLHFTLIQGRRVD